MQSNPNPSRMPSLFSMAIFHWRCLLFPPDPGLLEQNSEDNFAQRFPSRVLHFHTALFNKEQFFAGLSPSIFAHPLKKYPERSFTLCVSPTFGTKYPIGTIRIIFIHFSIRIFFYPDSLGSTSDSHWLSVNARPICIKYCPTLYLFDSHPLSVNVSFVMVFQVKKCGKIFTRL